MQDSIRILIKDLSRRCVSNKVFILGKGPSVDAIDIEQLPEGIVINLNDSERVRPGDVSIFSANWVRHALQDEGFNAGYYLAGKPLPQQIPHTVLSPIPLELDHDDLNTMRLEKSDFFDESFVLINAVKLALYIAREKNTTIDVYFLGFDFSASGGGSSRKMGVDQSGALQSDREAIIASQEQTFRQFLHYFAKADRLRLHHVGSKDFSSYSAAQFNVAICGVSTGLETSKINLCKPDRVLVVAEFTNNHLGNADRLIEMIERTKEAGADLIKVQKRDVDRFYSAEQLASYYWSPFGETLGDYRRGVELNDELFHLLNETCKKFEIEWFSTILDIESYHAIAKYHPRLMKVPSTISNHRNFHSELAKVYQGAIVVSTGYTEQEYVDYVLDTFSANEVIYLLHCISAYPTPRNACNVAVVRNYDKIHREIQKVIPGYSSHDLGSLGCMLAVGCGAKMIEKHVKLGDVEWVHFDKVAIDLQTNDFRSFVNDVRIAEEITGNEVKTVLDCEHHKYPVKSKP